MVEIFKKLNATKNYLILGNILLVFFFILLKNLDVLPVNNLGNFIFFVFLAQIFALYRPGWLFLFFVGALPLENINIAPAEIGIRLRPYQFFAAVTLIAVVARLILKRPAFKMPRLIWIDLAPVIFATSSLLVALLSANVGPNIKMSLVAFSFTAIYFLTRIFIQNLNDLKRVIPFFLSSGIIVVFYGIWQNWSFINGFNHFEVMPGRPNSTFMEADWLGIYLVFLAAIIYSLIIFLVDKEESDVDFKKIITNPRYVFLYIYLALIFILLIITVSRSAWLAMLVLTFSYLAIILSKNALKLSLLKWKIFWHQFFLLFGILIVSLIYVWAVPLTNFQLSNRAQSVGSGLQKITIACELKVVLPKKVDSIEELANFGCRHINLEEIEAEKTSGRYVAEILRTDPNVNVRSQIYRQSWQSLIRSPFWGLGWSSVGDLLGKDERGAALNSSNLFLEVWLGSGLLGFMAFALMWLYLLVSAVWKVFGKKREDQWLPKSAACFIIFAWLALSVPNLFNAGIFMGILWFFAGLTGIKYEDRN